MAIRYENLRTGDVVSCTGRGLFAAVTRAVTDGEIVHTGIILDVHGQKLLAEMQAGGLELNSLEKLGTKKKRNIKAIHRYSRILIDDRYELEAKIARDLRKTIEYDFKGLFEFVIPKIRNAKKKFYCSEYVFSTLKPYLGLYPLDFVKKVSPNDLYNYVKEDPHWTEVFV